MRQLGLSSTPAQLGDRRPRLRRSRSERIVAGVSAGLGRHLGVGPIWVRLAFAALSLAAGFGVVVYVLLWVLTPLEGVAPTGPAGHRTAPVLALSPRQLLGSFALVVGVLAFLYVTGFWIGAALPVSLAAIGFAVIWARGSGDEPRRIELANFRSPLDALARTRINRPRALAGAALVGSGMAVFLAATTSLEAAANVVLAVIVTTGGIGLLAGPWLIRLANDLIEERSSRIRSEARAELAAHLHDSVLQTLALIQRAKEPREMTSLARTQERELRAWLYGRAPTVRGVRLRDAVDATADRIERREHVKVEAVVVGDLEMDDDLRALVSASSEAALNAARHSGQSDVSLYVEVEDARVSAFIRDHGAGFDPTSVPADRRGITESIVKRMERHGGTAHVRSGPDGTEVELMMPRHAS